MKASAVDFSLAGDEFIGRSYEEMDCQAFVERCMKKVGINEDLPGSNAWYRAMTWVGTPEECKRKFGCIPKGALLYILKNDGQEPAKYHNDGIGNASHIGIKTGRGKGALHSSASMGCVCESNFADKTIPNGGWNRVGLDYRFDYGDKINSILNGGSQEEEYIEVVIPVYTAIVTSNNGAGANFRAKKSTATGYLGKIPEGTEVTVTADDGVWSSVIYNGKNGYVMSEFLAKCDDPGEYAENVTLMIPRVSAEALYNALADALGNGGGGVG